MKKLNFILIAALIFSTCLKTNISFAEPEETPGVKLADIEPFSKNDNILILSPHPDDETLGCAGIIQRALKAGAKVHIVYLTNGDSNQLAFIVYEKRLVFKKKEFLHMGEVRRKEAISAMKSLGVPLENLIFLGYPDFGTIVIFKNYWNTTRSFKSLLTRVSSVPYKENFSYGRPFKAESILTDIKEVVKRIKPNKIFVTSSVDTNGDHRALYIFLRLALLDLGEQFSKNIKIYAYLVHHRNWPKPRHYHPESELNIPKDMFNSDYLWRSFNLTEQEIKNKHNALLMYKSQTESSAFYLLSFVRKNELFLSVPDIKLKETTPVDDGLNWQGGFNALLGKESVVDSDAPEEVLSSSAISFAKKDKRLFVKVVLSRQPIITSFSIYLFGYKKQAAFSSMPKIRLKIIGSTISVLNGRQKLESKDVSLKRQDKDIIASIPVEVLNDPELIFCSVNIISASLPYDSNAWRIIKLK